MPAETPMHVPPLVPVRDSEEVAHRYQVMDRAVRLLGDRTLRLVAQPGWVAVSESGGIPSKAEGDRIGGLAHREGYDGLWALSLEERDVRDSEGQSLDWPLAFDIPATAEGVRAFLKMAGPFHYGLLPNDASWTVLTILRDERHLLLGAPETVAEILGRSVANAYDDYRYIAERERDRNLPAAGRMQTELDHLRERYPQLPPGATLPLTAEWATWTAPQR